MWSDAEAPLKIHKVPLRQNVVHFHELAEGMGASAGKLMMKLWQKYPRQDSVPSTEKGQKVQGRQGAQGLERAWRPGWAWSVSDQSSPRTAWRAVRRKVLFLVSWVVAKKSVEKTGKEEIMAGPSCHPLPLRMVFPTETNAKAATRCCFTVFWFCKKWLRYTSKTIKVLPYFVFSLKDLTGPNLKIYCLEL